MIHLRATTMLTPTAERKKFYDWRHDNEGLLEKLRDRARSFFQTRHERNADLDVTVIVGGSLGRLESTLASDLDLLVVYDRAGVDGETEKDRRRRAAALLRELVPECEGATLLDADYPDSLDDVDGYVEKVGGHPLERWWPAALPDVVFGGPLDHRQVYTDLDRRGESIRLQQLKLLIDTACVLNARRYQALRQIALDGLRIGAREDGLSKTFEQTVRAWWTQMDGEIARYEELGRDEKIYRWKLETFRLWQIAGLQWLAIGTTIADEKHEIPALLDRPPLERLLAPWLPWCREPHGDLGKAVAEAIYRYFSVVQRFDRSVRDAARNKRSTYSDQEYVALRDAEEAVGDFVSSVKGVYDQLFKLLPVSIKNYHGGPWVDLWTN